MSENKFNNISFKTFDRNSIDPTDDFSILGTGSIGGKAKGLAFIRNFLKENFPENQFKDINIQIPSLVVVTTSFFDTFMEMNNLYEVAYSDESDTSKASKFQKAELPVSLIGDLRSIITYKNTPLAIRSSSLLEDALYEPFAGIYATKMIPNNQYDENTRFKKLIEAIKFIYASTFFKKAIDYIKAVGKDIKDEKMSLIIQDVVGTKFGNRYYPEISGVARSFNYYSFGKSNPKDGVINLALGLGRTIVDGEVSWTYSPAYPVNALPFADVKSLIDNTQRQFWSVNLGKQHFYDPVNEIEFLLKDDINEAEEDGSLDLTCSTFDEGSNRIRPGTGFPGPRILNFNPILDLKLIALNELLKKLLKISEEALESPVEIEFALTLKKDNKLKPEFGFLQVRPMVVTNEEVEIKEEKINKENLLLNSNRVLGNGIINNIEDVIFVKPEVFDIGNSEKIAEEIEILNKSMQEQDKKYLLIGFGRWGSTDKWLGIPVEWGQISNAKVIVETMLPNFDVELSQGSHFFHNINSFQVLYFSIKSDFADSIDWEWLNSHNTITELNYTKHIRLKKPLLIKVDGRSAKGIIYK